MKNVPNEQPVVAPQPGVALLVIDVQTGLFHKATPIYNAEQLLRNIAENNPRNWILKGA